MDAVEEWLRERAKDRLGDSNMPKTRFDVCQDLAREWHENPGMVTVTYEADNPLHEFLDKVEGPAMIGLDPAIYPACVTCGGAWQMRRVRGTWSWQPDCSHKNGSCKLVRAT